MNLVHHKNLKPETWFAMTLAEQMANIGSEVGRTITWRNKRNSQYSGLAMERALELTDLTVSDPKNLNRLKEILRMREMLVDWYYFDNEYHSSDDLWQNYFLAFNHLARINR